MPRHRRPIFHGGLPSRSREAHRLEPHLFWKRRFAPEIWDRSASRPYLEGSIVHTKRAVFTVFVALSAVLFALRMMAMSSSVVPCSA